MHRMSPSLSPFVPATFNVPVGLTTSAFRLRMLTVHDVERDYDAVMSSVAHLRALWPHEEWPLGLTLEQNLIDLGWHQKEFQRRSSFAYTVESPDGARILGCVYINPTRKRSYNAEVVLWTRASEVAGGLDSSLHDAVRAWVSSDWPFERVAYPGRDIAWTDWRALPESPHESPHESAHT
jgi:hypothetical protein